MNRLKLSARFVRNQSRNLVRVMSGHPVTTPSLGSMTLDRDDVDIAKKWLRDPTKWWEWKIVRDYEREFAQWNGSKYAFSFMGGRVALSAIIYGLGLQPGDEVILPGYTCVVVPNAFCHAGVRPIYSDIELDTFGLDASLIEDKISSNTKAILLHHLYGIVCRDYVEIVRIAKKHNLYVIEDCAQSTGAEYKGVKVGNLGDAAFYSSEKSKIYNTVRGGIAVTSDQEIAARIHNYWQKASQPDEKSIGLHLNNLILNYYSQKHHQHWWLGDLLNIWYGDIGIVSTTKDEKRGMQPPNYIQKMPPAIAIIGQNQLRKIDHYNRLRINTAKKWESYCSKKGLRHPRIIPDSKPVYLRYPVLVSPDRKRNLAWAVKELGITPGVWYTSNIHPTDWVVRNCPNANLAVIQCINFPGIIVEVATD